MFKVLCGVFGMFMFDPSKKPRSAFFGIAGYLKSNLTVPPEILINLRHMDLKIESVYVRL